MKKAKRLIFFFEKLIVRIDICGAKKLSYFNSVNQNLFFKILAENFIK
jgi:hypothetical protein